MKSPRTKGKSLLHRGNSLKSPKKLKKSWTSKDKSERCKYNKTNYLKNLKILSSKADGMNFKAKTPMKKPSMLKSVSSKNDSTVKKNSSLKKSWFLMRSPTLLKS